MKKSLIALAISVIAAPAVALEETPFIEGGFTKINTEFGQTKGVNLKLGVQANEYVDIIFGLTKSGTDEDIYGYNLDISHWGYRLGGQVGFYFIEDSQMKVKAYIPLGLTVNDVTAKFAGYKDSHRHTSPYAGLGLKAEFSENVYANAEWLSYSYDVSEAGHTTKFSPDQFNINIGYRF